MYAAYSRTTLPGTETVTALNDSGDVVGASASGGVLWHGASHERISLPIIPTAIANDGAVAGSIDGHAATWKSGRVTVLDSASSIALAICRCASATVVGSVQVNGETHAAIWVGGIRIDAGVPPNSTHAEFSSIAGGFVVGNAIVRAHDPRVGGFMDFQRPFSWSPSGGWLPLVRDGQSFLATAKIVSLNSHGIGVGPGIEFNFPEVEGVFYDLAAGTSAPHEGDNLPLFNEIFPTGINDSLQVSETAQLASENGPATVALVAVQVLGSGVGPGLVLPPGVIGDQTAGINSAGIIGGQSNGLPVLWTPNP
jgi:hypothetical protein